MRTAWSKDPWEVGPPAGAGGVIGPALGALAFPKRKVKCNQVLDQADETEIPELGQADVDQFFEQLRRIKEVRFGRTRSRPRTRSPP